MNSTRPYLIRAFYDWISDNSCTPYLVVNATLEDVSVPLQHVEKGQIILNISMNAVQTLNLGNDAISFTARFSGISHNIFIPTNAVMAIYAKENGRGMIFTDDEDGTTPPTPTKGKSKDNKDSKSGSKTDGKGKGKGHLTVVK